MGRRKRKKQKKKKKVKKAAREIRLLEQGYVPSKTKFGSEFKGKNKIIVAK